MKTVTEFFGKTLKTIEEQIPAWTKELTASITETMKAEGKSEEEVAAGLPVVLKTQLDAKIGEVQKVEGEKLALLMGALTAIKGKRGNLKRVIVMIPASEGEKAPNGAFEVEGKFYLSEFFPEPARAHKGGRGDGKFEGRGGRDGKRGGKRGGRDGKRGEGRGDGRSGEGRGGDRPRGPRGPRPDGAPSVNGEVAAAGGAGPGAPGGEGRGRRPRRNNRPPRPPREPRANEPVRAPGEKWKIIPRSEMPVKTESAAPAASAAESTPTETSSS